MMRLTVLVIGMLAAGCRAQGAPAAAAAPVPVLKAGLDTAIRWKVAPRITAMCKAKAGAVPEHLKPFRASQRFLDYWKEVRNKPLAAPPKLDTTLALDSLTLPDLVLARAFVEARNGVVLLDPETRAFFEQFAWYQPVWFEEFVPTFSKAEKAWMARLDKEIKARHAQDRQVVGGFPRSRLNHVIDRHLFRALPGPVLRQLDTAGFSIVEGTDAQLWHMYDRNKYEHLPSFVTSDLYLQLLHMRFKMLLKDLESRQLAAQLGNALEALRTVNRARLKGAQDTGVKASAEWLDAYLGVASSLVRGKSKVAAAGAWGKVASLDLSRSLAADGKGSALAGDELFDHSQLKPRGHYDVNDTLRAYFRAVRWMGEFRIRTDDRVRFGAMLLLADDLQRNPKTAAKLKAWEEVVGAFAGPENGLSLRQILSVGAGGDLKAIVADSAALGEFGRKVASRDSTRMKPRASNDGLQAVVEAPTVRLLPRRWSADGEILQRLVHLRPWPGPRPFPTVMDLWAVQGIAQADTILLNEEMQAKFWPAYPDSLAAVRRTFAAGIPGEDFHAKRMRLLRAIFEVPKGQVPDFFPTPLWQRKNLLTASAAWTIQKQEVLLYQEQPSAVQCGGGGDDGPPPPEPKGYVEPVPTFWRGAAAVLDSVDALLRRLRLADEQVLSVNEDIRKDLLWLADCSDRELAGKPLSKEDHDKLQWIGGSVENQTLTVTGMDKFAFEKSEEKHMGSVVDVYTNDKVLLEATGPASVIWAVVPIEGELRLVRGAVFSHREWKGSLRLTDKEWHEMIEKGQMPPRSRWQDRIHAPVKKAISMPLETDGC